MDKQRILSKIDELNSYLEELGEIPITDFEEYARSKKDKRICERLLQISVETVLDICNILVSELKLGLPFDEDDLFKKLEAKKIITKELSITLKEMKGFRNILVHRYGGVDDEKVFEILSEKLNDFDKFKGEILKFLKNSNNKKNLKAKQKSATYLNT